MFKLKIKAKIIVIMLISIILPISIVGVTAYKSSSKTMTSQYRDLGKIIGKEITRSTEIKINQIEKGIGQISSASNVGEDSSTEEFKRFLDEYELRDVYFVSADGNTQSINSLKIDAQGEWYSKASESKDVVWSDMKKDELGNNWYITASKAVYKDSDFLGVIGVDVYIDFFDKILSEIRIGSSGFPILVDSKGVKIALKDTDEIGTEFRGKENFVGMAEKSKVIRNVIDKGGVMQDQFVIINKIPKLDWKLIAIVPIENVKESTNLILRNTLLVGIVMIGLGIATAILFGANITRPIYNVLKGVRNMEHGDFTAKIDIKNVDEFGQFRDVFNSTMDKLKMLILNIQDISVEVSKSSEALAATTEETSASIEGVSKAIEEIAKGASVQAADTEVSAELIEKLADKLVDLGDNSENILDAVAEVRKTSIDSTKVVEDLKEKSELNAENTGSVAEQIINLDTRISEVGGILTTIDEIAEQTNLLALNASIEAARAGEYGTGFAVVAEEIRKLAQESKASSNTIKNIITGIQEESKYTVEVMTDVKTKNEEQTDIVLKVNEAFNTIGYLIEDTTKKIEYVGECIRDINGDRDKIVSSIENISSVSQQTASASEEVSASIHQQASATEEVARSAELLNELSHNLNAELSRFKI